MTALTTLILFCLLFISPLSASGAEALKLWHIGSVYADGKGIGLMRPEGVACNDNSTFVVADTGNGRLLSYSLNNGKTEGGTPIAAPELSRPLTVQMNPRGDIFILEGKQRKIFRIGSEGKQRGFIDPSGLPVPQEYGVGNFKIAGDELYILDIYSGRVLLIDSAYKYVRHIPFPKTYGYISDLAVDKEGTVFLLDSAKRIIYSASKTAKEFLPFSAKLEEYAGFPTGMSLGPQGTIYLLDRSGSSVAIIGKDGAFRGRALGLGWKEGLLNRPTQLCINGKGEVFIADSANNRVQVFNIVK